MKEPKSADVKKFWKKAFNLIETGMVGNCRCCPYEARCKELPSIEEGGVDCATFLRGMYDEDHFGVKFKPEDYL